MMSENLIQAPEWSRRKLIRSIALGAAESATWGMNTLMRFMGTPIVLRSCARWLSGWSKCRPLLS